MDQNIILPHANRFSVPVLAFIDAWRSLVKQHLPEADWRSTAIPRLNRAVTLQNLLDAGHHYSLDVLCRNLVGPVYRNTMQATNPFMEENRLWITRDRAVNPITGRTVQAARLSEIALIEWDKHGASEGSP